MITLYGNASPNVLKIGIALDELGLDYAWKHVNIWSGEQFSPTIRRLNPLSKVPILVEEAASGETVLFESGAILLHLAEKADGGIIPTDPSARLEALKWLFVQCANIGPMFGQLSHFTRFGPQTADYALQRYRAQVRQLYAILETRLAEHPYLGGETYSVADIATYPWIRLHDMHVERLGPAVSRWFSTLSERPAIERAVRRHETQIRPADRAMMEAARSSDLDALFPGRGQG